MNYNQIGYALVLGSIVGTGAYKMYNNMKANEKSKKEKVHPEFEPEEEFSIEKKFKKDLKNIVKEINYSPDKDSIIKMFEIGPPEDKGFMWCTERDWSMIEYGKAFRKVENMVLIRGWDSSGYSMMMRAVQKEIVNQTSYV